MIDGYTLPWLEFSAYLNLIVWLSITAFTMFYMKLPMYHPIFIYLVYHFLGFVIRPFNIVSNDGSFLWARIGFVPDVGDIVLSIIVCNLALVSVTIGFVWAHKKTFYQLYIPTPSPFELHVEKIKPFLLALVTLLILGLYGNYISVVGAGFESVLAYETSLDGAGGRRLTGVSGYQTALAEFLPITLIILFMIPRFRKIAILLILAYIAIRMYSGGQRLSFVVVLAALFFYYHVSKNLRFPRIKPIIFILIFAIIFEIIGNDRYAFRSILAGEKTISEVVEHYIEERGGNALTSDIVEFDVSTAAVSVITENNDYSYWSQYLRILVWPIPRQMWPDKPVYTSIVDLNNYGNFTYLTTGVYADTYMAFSFFSLILMMLLLGVFFGYIYKVLYDSKNPYLFMFFWVFLIYEKTILRDGGVTVIYFWIFSMFAAAILIKAGGIKIWRKS
jgi:oligosaccharide repeat unit polymerase